MIIWRRHTQNCPHRTKGRDFLKCTCRLWADGYKEGRRVFRLSLKTRDYARALKRAATLDQPDALILESIDTAVKAFMDQCNDLQGSTQRTYKNVLEQLKTFCHARGEDTVTELSTETLDAFRASRKLKPITSLKELQMLKLFFSFCFDRRWVRQNIAKPIKGPRNIRPNDTEPYTPNEVAKILGACDTFGRGAYERARAQAMILLLRFTGLRIGDIATLARDRVTWDSGNGRWRIFLRTEKTGASVFLPVPDALKHALDSLPDPRGAGTEPKHYFWNGVTSRRAAIGIAERTLAAVFKKSGVKGAHAHRFRHTMATELLGRGGSFEDVAGILGNSPAVVRKHYGKWSAARQARIDSLMRGVDLGTNWAQTEKGAVTH